ncbi:MAG: hypothetical protein ACOX6J_07260 [Oscillospiraceae bacterium]|jgi:hypothetical protein
MNIRRLLRSSAAVILAVITAAALGACSSEEEVTVPDFEQSYWGDNRTTVTETETSDYAYASDEIILYEKTENGTECEVYYLFTDGLLTSGEIHYGTGDEGISISDAITLYTTLRESITATYGDPDDQGLVDGYKRIDETSAYYEEHKDESDDQRFQYGFLSYDTKWTTDRSTMQLLMEYDSGAVKLVFYASQNSTTESSS